MEPNYYPPEQELQHLEGDGYMQTEISTEHLSRDEELEDVKRKLKEIEEETGNLRQKHAQMQKEIGGAVEELDMTD